MTSPLKVAWSKLTWSCLAAREARKHLLVKGQSVWLKIRFPLRGKIRTSIYKATISISHREYQTDYWCIFIVISFPECYHLLRTRRTPMPSQWLSNFSRHQSHLLKHRLLRPSPALSCSGGSKWDQIICISRRSWVILMLLAWKSYLRISCSKQMEEKGITKDEMVGRHHWLSGHEFEQAPGDSEGQGSLACCSPWGRIQSDTT